MQHKSESLPDVLPEMSNETARVILDSAARAVARRGATINAHDRAVLAQSATLDAMIMVADGADVADAVRMATAQRVRHYWQDVAANETTTLPDYWGALADSERADGRLVSAWSPMAPDTIATTTAHDIGAEVGDRLWAVRPDLALAVASWLDSERANTGAPRAMGATLGAVVGAAGRPVVADVLRTHAEERQTLKRSQWSDTDRALSAPARPGGRTGQRMVPMSGPASDVVITRPDGTVWRERWERRPCDHDACYAWRMGIRTEHGQAALTLVSSTGAHDANGAYLRLCPAPDSRPAVDPLHGPVCLGPCPHASCDLVRRHGVPCKAGDVAAVPTRVRVVERIDGAEVTDVLGDVHARGAYVATGSDRSADDLAYAQTPVGPVVKASGRRKSKSGGIGTSTTMRGPRHAWRDRTNTRQS